MGRESGRIWRKLSRIFRERQIYHRSDGVVRFIKLSTQTQIALASILLGALLWVAYASVNVVFKEQIIVGKDRERRIQEAAYRKRIQDSETALDDVSALNVIYTQEFDASLTQLQNRHEAMRAIVENKISGDIALEQLASTLATSGGPEGVRMNNGNRIMVDPVGREPTPRQSRTAKLKEEALQEVLSTKLSANIQDPVLTKMRQSAAEYSAKQVLLLASIEEDIRKQSAELEAILETTGIDVHPVIDRERLAQITLASDFAEDDYSGVGGPFVPAADDAVVDATSVYYQSARRIEAQLTDLQVLSTVISAIPVASPVDVRYRMSSGFGVRWDPFIKNKKANHQGMDFAAPRNSDILASAPGRVSFAGVRTGYGNCVEIDHGNGLMTRYAHLNRISVNSGQKVKLHQVIGKLGCTGRCSGSHLHYEVHYKGNQIDPERFIKAGRYVFES